MLLVQNFCGNYTVYVSLIGLCRQLIESCCSINHFIYKSFVITKFWSCFPFWSEKINCRLKIKFGVTTSLLLNILTEQSTHKRIALFSCGRAKDVPHFHGDSVFRSNKSVRSTSTEMREENVFMQIKLGEPKYP